MNIRLSKSNRGIAIIIVMIVILVLGILAGGFAYSMRVEMRLAQQSNYETDFEWMGRSGVELARCVVVEQFKNRSVAGTSVDALNQKWAGDQGGGSTNILPDISLDDVEIGAGRISVKIVDADRKININRNNPQLMMEILNRAMRQIGVDASEASVVVDSILDWIDKDDDERINGAETAYYMRQDPPYVAKNGPLDDITELLLIRGIRENPAIFWGSNSTNYTPSAFMFRESGFRDKRMPEYPIGLNDLFTTVSSGRVNGNTASDSRTASDDVMQVLTGDPNLASMLLQHRRGPDGQDGTEDDKPFNNVNEIVAILGTAANSQFINQTFGVNSSVFEVTVTCRIGDFTREYVALIYRMNQRDANVLYMYWKRGSNTGTGAPGHGG